MIELDTILTQLEDEPWNADDIIEPLDKKTRKLLHQKLLELCRTKPTSAVVSSLAQFPGKDTFDALLTVMSTRTPGVLEELAQVLGELAEKGGPRFSEALRTLVAHKKSSVARQAIEALPDSTAHTALVLERFDAFAKSGDDLLLLAAIEKLTPKLGENAEVLAAFARHWDFGIRKTNTLMASNAIFDALIEHRGDDPVARGVFEAAAKHEHEYAQVRGLAALALTGVDTRENRKRLVALQLKELSSRALRNAAIKLLNAARAKSRG